MYMYISMDRMHIVKYVLAQCYSEARDCWAVIGQDKELCEQSLEHLLETLMRCVPYDERADDSADKTRPPTRIATVNALSVNSHRRFSGFVIKFSLILSASMYVVLFTQSISLYLWYVSVHMRINGTVSRAGSG